MPKLTDAKRFKLPYRDAATTERPGYLRKRMQQYRELQQQQDQATARVVQPLRKAAK